MAASGTSPNPSVVAKPEVNSVQLDEERMAHALVTRGLVTRDEAQKCRTAPGMESGPEALLTRLVRAGFLTANQGQRARQELYALLHQQIPGYELLERLGLGSMGTVYKARQLSMDRLVAIKILHPRLAAKQDLLTRLDHEAHLAAKLSHNNIVQAIDVGVAGSFHYFVMEYVEGTTIKHELESGKIYDEREALQLVLQIAHALQHAHRRGLIHRDVKPANIILTRERVAKLADLGMARLATDEERSRAERGMTIGTPFYISPEQIYPLEEIDGRADIYSLGATLYHMVTGQPPFPGTKVEEVLRAHLEQELTPPDHLNTALSCGLGEVVEFMMAKDRGQRYPSADDLILDLECLLGGRPPKLARERIAIGRLKELAKGEVEADAEEEPETTVAPPDQSNQVWVIIFACVLAVSFFFNIVLLLKLI